MGIFSEVHCVVPVHKPVLQDREKCDKSQNGDTERKQPGNQRTLFPVALSGGWIFPGGFPEFRSFRCDGHCPIENLCEAEAIFAASTSRYDISRGSAGN